MMGSYFHKGVLYLMGTWLSGPGEVPEDFPEYFTTEDMEKENLQPDLDGMARVQRWKERFYD